jgi:hypothetical protein
MRIYGLTLLLVCAGLGSAADKPVWQKAELEDVEFSFRLVQDVDEIERLVGDRLDEDFTLVEVRLRALYGTKVELNRSSFTLRSFSGNDHSLAQSPDRIAGAGSLMVRPGTSGGGGVYTRGREQIPLGRGPEGGAPRQTTGVPSEFGGSLPDGGSPGTSQRGVEVPAVASDAGVSLRDRLEWHELPLKAGDRDVSGYLYFQLDPKHKLKNISLTYAGRYGEVRVAFKN